MRAHHLRVTRLSYTTASIKSCCGKQPASCRTLKLGRKMTFICRYLLAHQLLRGNAIFGKKRRAAHSHEERKAFWPEALTDTHLPLEPWGGGIRQNPVTNKAPPFDFVRCLSTPTLGIWSCCTTSRQKLSCLLVIRDTVQSSFVPDWTFVPERKNKNANLVQ